MCADENVGIEKTGLDVSNVIDMVSGGNACSAQVLLELLTYLRDDKRTWISEVNVLINLGIQAERVCRFYVLCGKSILAMHNTITAVTIGIISIAQLNNDIDAICMADTDVPI